MVYKLFFSFVCFFLVFFQGRAHSQEFDEAFYKSNLKTKSYALDTSAEAIILYEKGTAHIKLVGNGYKLAFAVRRIIKILKTSGQNNGNVKELYRNSPHHVGMVMNIRGATYNLVNGNVVKTELDKSTIADKKTNHNFNEFAFAMPLVTEGSIVDYEYETITFLFSVLPSWEFQGDIPKLVSEYEVVAPVAYKFNSLSQGGIDFKKFNSVKEAESEHATSYEVVSPATGDRYSMYWVRKNIAAVSEEPVISTIYNYMQTLELQMAGYDQAEILASWKQFDRDLLTDGSFGGQLAKANSFLNDIVDSFTQHESSALQKAKNIFNYVRSHYDCSGFNNVGCERGIKEAYESKRGDDAEINLLLVAMLRKAGLPAKPLVLSKMGEMRVTTKFPLANRFNYVACVVEIEGRQYFLDGTFRYNPFGELPAYCYNGVARIIDEHGSFEQLPPYKQTLKCNYNVDISRVTDSSFDVSVRERYSSVKTAHLRDDLVADSLNLTKHIKERIETFHDNARITGSSVDNLNDPDKDLVIRYTFEISRQPSEMMYMNTDLIKFYKTNPFVAGSRTLPIEFPYKYDLSYTMNILTPNDYKIEDLPPTTNVKRDDYGLSFDHSVLYDTAARLITVKSRLVQNSTTVPAADYEQVKSFIDRSIAEQNGTIVLKKNSKQ